MIASNETASASNVVAVVWPITTCRYEWVDDEESVKERRRQEHRAACQQAFAAPVATTRPTRHRVPDVTHERRLLGKWKR